MVHARTRWRTSNICATIITGRNAKPSQALDDRRTIRAHIPTENSTVFSEDFNKTPSLLVSSLSRMNVFAPPPPPPPAADTQLLCSVTFGNASLTNSWSSPFSFTPEGTKIFRHAEQGQEVVVRDAVPFPHGLDMRGLSCTGISPFTGLARSDQIQPFTKMGVHKTCVRQAESIT